MLKNRSILPGPVGTHITGSIHRNIRRLVCALAITVEEVIIEEAAVVEIEEETPFEQEFVEEDPVLPRNEAEMQSHDPVKSTFTVGNTFGSFSQLDESITDFQTENHVQLWKREARSISAAKARLTERHIDPHLKYYELKYCCIHGGKQFTSDGKGKKTHSKKSIYDVNVACSSSLKTVECVVVNGYCCV